MACELPCRELEYTTMLSGFQVQMYIYMAFFNEYYSFVHITELDTLYAKFMLQVGLVHASQRHQIFIHLQSVYNSLPPLAEAKHYTA